MNKKQRILCNTSLKMSILDVNYKNRKICYRTKLRKKFLKLEQISMKPTCIAYTNTNEYTDPWFHQTFKNKLYSDENGYVISAVVFVLDLANHDDFRRIGQKVGCFLEHFCLLFDP